MTPPTVPEAIDLYNSITSLISPDGDTTTKRQAQSVEIVRLAEDWRIQFTQLDKITLPSGKVIEQTVKPITEFASDIITKTVTTPDGKVWPLAVVFALINQYYKDVAST